MTPAERNRKRIFFRALVVTRKTMGPKEMETKPFETFETVISQKIACFTNKKILEKKTVR